MLKRLGLLLACAAAILLPALTLAHGIPGADKQRRLEGGCLQAIKPAAFEQLDGQRGKE